ncbi:hypothetical protein [Serratia proteamaculans]|uniref:hypothetical protein n=1 Tax=Serratia proteamaculans TaxID=28151 RepID=UPI0021BD5129|nr:hypothetical protein [Serratia proteamaculans]
MPAQLAVYLVLQNVAVVTPNIRAVHKPPLPAAPGGGHTLCRPADATVPFKVMALRVQGQSPLDLHRHPLEYQRILRRPLHPVPTAAMKYHHG